MENTTNHTDIQKKERKSRRNKHKVRYDLLDAVGKTLREHGFAHLGINLVAEIAGTDKNSIYRHFGTFEQLLDQYIEKQDFWIKSLSAIKETKIKDYKEFMKGILYEQYETINGNREIQQLLIWELGELSLRTKAVGQRREKLSEAIMKQYEECFQGIPIDFNVISAILIAGIYYLILHKDHSTFCQIDFKNEKARVLNGINQFVDILFSAKETISMQQKIALNALKYGMPANEVSLITELPLDHIEQLQKRIS